MVSLLYRRTQLILLWEDELHVGQLPEARTYATLLSAQLPALLSLSYKQPEGRSIVIELKVSPENLNIPTHHPFPQIDLILHNNVVAIIFFSQVRALEITVINWQVPCPPNNYMYRGHSRYQPKGGRYLPNLQPQIFLQPSISVFSQKQSGSYLKNNLFAVVRTTPA